MDVRLLGPTEVTCGKGAVPLGGPTPRAVFAMLALDAGSTVSAERLIDGLWGEDPPATARKLVQLYVSNLRKALANGSEPQAIVTHGRGYELQLDREHIDVARFERLLAQGAARDALSLWRGPALADIVDEPFAAVEVRRLEELRATAHEMAIEHDLDAGLHREVLAELETLLAHEPLRERLHAQRMLALYRSGRQADALEAYRSARSILVDQIGVEPGPDLRRMQEAILRQDPSLDPPEHALPELERYAETVREQGGRRLGDAATRASAERAEWMAAEDDLVAGIVELQVLREHKHARRNPDASPFKGLDVFDIGDADVFFGRERLVADMVARLVGTRLMGVVGPSGSGKSSAMRAGLLAALADGVLPHSDTWRRVVIRPGEHPLRTLDAALDMLGDGGLCVVAVDQFEEVFTACRDEGERAAFIDALVGLARDSRRRTTVVLALRADFYGHCAEYPELSRMLGTNHVLVGAMRREELRRAIEMPARRVGVQVQPELTDRLIADVEGEPGGLPLLSTTLLELWELRDGGTLRLDAYGQTGGVRGAVARLAETSYERLDARQRDDARRILLRLAGDGDVRARVPVGELNGTPGAHETLSRLASDRLVTIGDGEAEVAHEALLREWPRLRGWLDDDADGRRVHQHLTHSARDWHAEGRDAGGLYRGSRLAAASEWATHHDADLNDLERDFLAASNASAEAEAERQRQANRRLRTLLAGVGALLVLAVIAGVVAVAQRGEARDAALVADAQRLGAEAVTNDRLDQAVRLARTGIALDDSPATRNSLFSVLLRQPASLGELRGDGWKLYSVGASPDGKLVAIGDERGGVIVYDIARRARVGYYHVETGDLVQDLVFAPDSRALALTLYAGRTSATFVDVVDPRGGKRIRRFELPAFPRDTYYVLTRAAFAPNGRDLIAEQTGLEFPDGGPAILSRLDGATGKVAQSRPIGRSSAWSLATTPSGRVFVTTPKDDRTYEIEPGTLRVERTYKSGGTNVAVSADGETLALVSADGRMRLLDTESGRTRTLAGRHRDERVWLAFTPDGRTLVSAGNLGSVVVWDVGRGAVRERIRAHAPGGSALAMAPDGRTFYTAANDARMAIWDLAGTRRLDRHFPVGPAMTYDDGSPKGTAMSPDGKRLAVTQMDGSVWLVDPQTLAVLRKAKVQKGALLAAGFSPNGKLLAVIGEHPRVTLLNAETLEPVRTLPSLHGRSSQAVTFSPDGRLVAAAALTDSGGRLAGVGRVWDVRSGKAARVRMKVSGNSLSFSPDGRYLAGDGAEVDVGGNAEVYDVRSGKRVTIPTGDLVRSVAFSHDGRLLAVGHYGGTVALVSTADWKPSGRRLAGHQARVTAVEFSPDDRTLVTGSADGTARLWGVRTRRPLGTALAIKPDSFVAATFGSRGSHLFAIPSHGDAVRWDVRPESWKRHACRVAGRDLTRTEWHEILPNRQYRPVCAAR
jgi:WD40 repeat protein/DNA-binding SARP family transcriptional activator